MDNNILEVMNADGASAEVLHKTKTTLTSNMNSDKVLNVLRRIVNDSDCVEFYSNRHSKFINAVRPELILRLDLEAAALKYPHLANDMMRKDNVEKLRDARSAAIQAEIAAPLMNFFTAALQTIFGEELHPPMSDYIDDVQTVFEGRDIAKLRDEINNVVKLRDKDGQLTDDACFLMVVTTSVGLPSDEELLAEDGDEQHVSVELMY